MRFKSSSGSGMPASILVAAMLVLVRLAAAGESVPHAALSPEQVVRAQVEALARNDVPHRDRGIEITWRFASPNNKRFTGPLERFKVMVHNPSYEPMVNHRGAEYDNLHIDGNRATIEVFLLSKDNEYVGYHFRLSRQQDDECGVCWMTDAVMRIAVTGS